MQYYSPFPVAILQKRVRSHALLTRPPLDPKVSLDLHVLGLPPAFVLSQDQTLKLKTDCSVILDVRTSAHLIRWLNRMKSSVCVLRVSSETESRTNSEADTSSSGRNPRSAIYRRLIHRMNQGRPHISSDISDVKQRERQKPDQCALTCRRARPSTSRISCRLVCVSSASPPRRRPVWRPVVRLSAAGEGAFTDSAGNPQALFSKKSNFSRFSSLRA